MLDFRLYVILDPEILRQSSQELLETSRRIILAGAEIIQLRAKNSTDRKILELGLAMKKLTRRTKTLFLLNDRADLASLIGADGVHLGQEDLPVKVARKILGKQRIIGLSTHNLDQAQQAEKDNADYISLGPIFNTPLKPESNPISAETITQIKEKIKIPFVAVGGINLNNLQQVLVLGAERVAVCRAIIAAEDVSFATKEFRRRLYFQHDAVRTS